MALRIADAPLVAEQGHEPAGQMEGVRQLLGPPPRVLAIPVVVVAAPGPVQVGGVDEVAPGIHEAPVPGPVAADLGVAVELPPHQAQRLAAHLRAIFPHCRDLFQLLLDAGDRADRALRRHIPQLCLPRAGRGEVLVGNEVEIEVVAVRVSSLGLGEPMVRRSDRQKPARAGHREGGPLVQQPVRPSEVDRPLPRRAVEPRRVLEPAGAERAPDVAGRRPVGQEHVSRPVRGDAGVPFAGDFAARVRSLVGSASRSQSGIRLRAVLGPSGSLRRTAVHRV